MNISVTEPELHLPGFSLATARECAQFSRAAYDEPPTIQNSETDTQVLIADVGPCIIVAFRGTQGAKDFLTDARFGFIHIAGGCEVHAGFWRAWKSVMVQVIGKLNDLPSKPIIFTGHSLGGALAMLAAFDCSISTLKEEVEAVYTFGQPRIGNQRFASYYDSQPCGSPVPLVTGNYSENEVDRPTLGERTFRFIHGEDIVPRVPGLMMGYRHAGEALFFSSFDRLEFRPSFWLMALSDLFGICEAWMIRRELTFLTSHAIHSYIDKLNEAS